ncbi:hypothetical protein [Runella slithyformis]|uniref:DUF3147 family protein n=1 Tax=Runella slithyformis (strain ATCC 29530 / DSM 19594 / LMG 11500 / NCIMB 11436 / LSU 4) TaxID=761193 RepID=A0A7U3ZQK2_RUNSL|nr:hypothetical protein [Runella slithyformis]AEI51544.1 hypothetical protein Runsl_5245 [Runella slithyformis DSM 19594]
MTVLFFKLTMMPVVIGGITLISRKWGNSIGGIIGSMPWVAGPILVFFILEQGTAFGIRAIPGILTGVVSLVGFCFCYALVSKRFGWFPTLLSSYSAFVATALVLDALRLSLWSVYGVAVVSIVTALRRFPLPAAESTPSRRALPPKFDIPFRMLVATLFVLAITTLAKALGPTWSGILTPFPIITSILAIFTHYLQGSNAAITILKGIMLGLVGFTTFLFLQAFFLREFPIAVSFLLAFVINALINLAAVRWLR